MKTLFLPVGVQLTVHHNTLSFTSVSVSDLMEEAKVKLEPADHDLFSTSRCTPSLELDQ